MPPAPKTSSREKMGRLNQIVTVMPDSDLYRKVRKLGDANRDRTGHLPFAAWDDYADKGHLLCIVEPEQAEPIAYLSYRTPRDEVAIAHLVVTDEARGGGLARQLIEHLAHQYAERRGISLWCRRDWPAHTMWPRLGFVPRGDRNGRGKDGGVLTLWWRDHGHHDLFSWQGPTERLRPIVIDNNVFLDLHGAPGPHTNQTRALLLDVLDGRVELLLTPEVHTEIDRNVPRRERARLHAVADAYPRLPVLPDRFNAMAELLASGSPRRGKRVQDESDLRHVAYAAAAGVDIVVTRDEDVITKLGPHAKAVLGLTLVNAHDLVTLLDATENAPAYWPAALLGTGYTVTELTATVENILNAFLDTGAGERKNSFRSTLRQLAGRRPEAHRLVYRDPIGEAVGLLGAYADGKVLHVSILRIKPAALAASLATQMITRLRDLATNAGVEAVRILEPHLSSVLFKAAEEDGFFPADDALVAIVLDKTLDCHALSSNLERAVHTLGTKLPATLAEAIQRAQQSDAAAALEHQLRPLRLLDADLPTFLIPIKPIWSSQLFNAPPQLFGQPDSLGISKEHVYYRAPRSAGEVSPARIFWYASQPESQVVACSALIDVEQGSAEDLWRKHQRLGVYTRQNVLETAGKQGVVRCLRVADTEVLTHPVPLDRLRQLAKSSSQTLPLRSPQKINSRLFTAIMEEARHGR